MEDFSIPFYLLGDGFKMLYVTLALAAAAYDGYVLIEEPENFQHPSSMELMLRGLVNIAKEGEKCQLFMSTHNEELIKKLLALCEEANIDLRVFRLELKRGELKSVAYDLEEAKACVEDLGADLRG